MKRLVWLLFFLSGACGLVYEVVWVRMMTHVFGTTAVALGTVLAAFMTGLALGSWLLGKAADRSRNPLRLYALLELGVGFAALGAHEALNRIVPAYLAAYDLFGQSSAALGVVRFVLAFGVVLIPTILMGATLPVLSRFVLTRLANVGSGLSSLYAINTVGAVAGTLVAGFLLVGAFGVHRSVHLAVAGNLGIGLLAWLLSMRVPAPLRTSPAAAGAAAAVSGGEAIGSGPVRLLLAGLLVSGFTSFAYEIYWTRSLVFLMGNSTYAVTTMLAAFLTGIALGGYLIRFVMERIGDRVSLFGWIQVLIALTAATVLPVLFAFTEPAAIREHLIEASEDPARILALRFGVAFLVMLVPAILIGSTFPLVGRIVLRDLERRGATVGRVYAVNTIGNVMGALLPGLVLLNWLGIQRGILAMAVLNTGVGFTLIIFRGGVSSRHRAIQAAAVAAIVLAFISLPLEFQFPSRNQQVEDRVLYYGEGPSATTKVFLNPETREKSMSVDGITIGGTGYIDYKQQLLAHLPKLLTEDVSTELSVGLGSSILVGESLRHRRVEEVTCVEIEPSVVAGAVSFREEAHGVLGDARLRIVVDDVLNHLRTTQDVYDVISADEKTLMDYASNGLSYSREYYALLGNRLAPGGILIQWVPTGLPHRLYKMVLKTFTDSFAHVLLWYSPPAVQQGPSNTILIGSTDPLDLDLTHMQRILEEDGASFEGLARYGLTDARAIAAHFVADERRLRDAVADALENTLDHPRYEFFSRGDYTVPLWQRLMTNHDFLVHLRQEALPELLERVASGGPEAQEMKEAFTAEGLCLEGFRLGLAAAPESEITSRFETALASAPWNESIRSRVFLHYRMMAKEYASRGLVAPAARSMERALDVYGRSALTRTEYAILLLRLGAKDQAMLQVQAAVASDPGLVLARRILAHLLIEVGRRDEAAAQLKALLEIEPEDALAREILARF